MKTPSASSPRPTGRNAQRGFTLIELTVLISIVAVLGSLQLASPR